MFWPKIKLQLRRKVQFINMYIDMQTVVLDFWIYLGPQEYVIAIVLTLGVPKIISENITMCLYHLSDLNPEIVNLVEILRRWPARTYLYWAIMTKAADDLKLQCTASVHQQPSYKHIYPPIPQILHHKSKICLSILHIGYHAIMLSFHTYFMLNQGCTLSI